MKQVYFWMALLTLGVPAFGQTLDHVVDGEL